MAIVPVNTGTTANDGTGDDLKVAFEKVNTGLLELENDLASVDTAAYLESVSGGAGFVDVSGTVAMDLSGSRAFLHAMTGNITNLSFANLPDANLVAATWTWVLRVDTAGSLSNLPTVTWLNGGAWTDLTLTAGVTNVVIFTRLGTTTFASIIWTGETALDSYKVTFTADGTYPYATDAESIDLANFTKPVGDGVVTFTKSGAGGDISARTDFAVGDWLEITVTGLTTPTTIRIPRYTL